MSSDSGDFLDTAEGEVSLFRSIMRTRPVAMHRHVHILAIHNSIYRDTGFKVPMKDIWDKLGKMYDLDALENAVSVLQPCCLVTPSSCAFDTRALPIRSWLTVHSWLSAFLFPCRSSTVMTPTPAPTPHIQTKTSRYTRASKRNSTHPLTMKATNPTSQLDASGVPHPLQRHHRRLRQVPVGLGVHQIPAYERAIWERSRGIRKNSSWLGWTTAIVAP